MSANGLRTVLYIDDEPDIRTIVQIALGLSSNLTVHTGDSGIHALELARKLRPDVVLLDVMMPGLDGPATLTKMRADPEIAHIPVIFITAKAMLLGEQLAGMWQERPPVPIAVEADVESGEALDETNVHLHVARLGEKFLRRSRDEAVVLRALTEHAHEGDPIVIDEIERMAHKIHGSGTMFGFPALSARAAEIEQIIERYKPTEPTISISIDASALQRLIECTQELAHEVEAATVN
jgi:CheY-like chemotaxis protein